ncbi:hypothetical protein J2I47_22355 [Fibrella sp. HMF5335]|uniref:Uncharacterized protein n=1 Tax=Fibrella rubiginis TaxID=2817060 RepID=A0A939GHK9_9BACT|nr:hypothetical protein [Fibrella rubiginis]MBO0939312.1 hypothetical protein [Fibrella rubiginis]
MKALLAAVDLNNVYIKAGRRCLDSCRTVKVGIQQAPSTLLIRQNRRLLEQEFTVLRQKIHRQVSLTCIDLIYQRKRERELMCRQGQTRQLAHDLVLRSLTKNEDLYSAALSSFVRETAVKLLQKQALIDQHRSMLVMLTGNQNVAFTDTIYPPILSKKMRLKHAKHLGRFDAEYGGWWSRFVLLRQLMDVDSTAIERTKSFRVLYREFKNGQYTTGEFMSQLVNRYRLIDAQMRTERDLYVAAIHLMSYTKEIAR